MLLHRYPKETPLQLHCLIQNYLAQFDFTQADIPVGDELDEQLLGAIAQFDAIAAHSPDTCESQARYLAEEIYLAHDRYSQDLESGVIKFIETFVRLNFPDDAEKRQVAESICREIRSHPPVASQEAAELHALFANGPELPVLETWPGETVQEADQHAGRTAVRCGDVVVLPTDAEVFAIGDLHSDPHSTRAILDAIKLATRLDDAAADAAAAGAPDAKRPYIVFLGDYGNNGLDAVGNLLEILRFQQAYPEHVVLLSGNHEYHETLYTALNEFFNVHWTNATQSPYAGKLPPHHYGHVRLDFLRRFGVVEGETLYRAFVAWGLRLTYVCFGAGGRLMLSHTVGKAPGIDGPIRFADLLTAKRDDALCIKQASFDVCKQRQPSQHTAMVGNRVIDVALLEEFSALGVTHIAVGHSHYRSGDILHNAPTLVTLCASHPGSPDAGHYIYQEMHINRTRKRDQESLPSGDAYPCFVSFCRALTPKSVLKMTAHPVILSESTKG